LYVHDSHSGGGKGRERASNLQRSNIRKKTKLKGIKKRKIALKETSLSSLKKPNNKKKEPLLTSKGLGKGCNQAASEEEGKTPCIAYPKEPKGRGTLFFEKKKDCGEKIGGVIRSYLPLGKPPEAKRFEAPHLYREEKTTKSD